MKVDQKNRINQREIGTEIDEEERLCNWISQRTNTPRSRSMGDDTVEVDTERRLV
jgi:hypothetical protein